MAIASTLLTGRARPLRALRGHLILMGALLVVGLCMVGTLMILLVASVLGPPVRRRRRSQAIISGLFRGLLYLGNRSGIVQSDLSELDALVDRGPLVVVANHPCLLDAMLIVSRLPAAVCIMKSQLCRHPLLGVGSWLAGYVPNGSPTQLVRQSVRALAEGSQLVVFPEGTRTHGRPMADMKGAFATIAVRAACPVVMVAIDADSDYATKGWPLWRLPTFPLRYRIRLIGELDGVSSREVLMRDTALRFDRELAPVAAVAARESLARP